MYYTKFQVEVKVILGLSKGYKGVNIAMFSDSQVVIRALDSDTISSSLVWECSVLCPVLTQ